MERVAPRVTLATSQFPVTRDIRRNARYICRHISLAAEQGADVLLFPETALSGYAGHDFDDFARFDWVALQRAFEKVQEAARQSGLWVLVGSAHYLAPSARPRNSLFVIDPRGKIRTRYDKSMLYRSELDHFSPGGTPITFTIDRVQCGALICFDSCFPRLYEELEERRVKIVFHAYYNAGKEAPGKIDDLIHAQARARAYDGSYFVVGANSARRYSAASSFIAGPDGRFRALPRHRAGVLLESIATDDTFWKYRRDRSPAIRASEAAARNARDRHARARDRSAPPFGES